MSRKVVMITGSSRGIGRETAVHLAKLGYRVFATMRHPEACQEFVELDEEARKLVTIKALDVTDPIKVYGIITDIIESCGRIDVVINNAGSALYSPVELASEEEVQHQFEVNVFGALRVIRTILPYMRSQKSGHIINISSIAGLVSNPALGIYSATKHALEAISESLATNVFPWNIKVTVVEPGATATEFAEVMQIGEVAKGKNPYTKFLEKYKELFTKYLSEGQDPKEIATLIGKIIEMEKPDFRYQTSKELTEKVSELIVDTTGNVWVDHQKELFGEWLKEL